MTSVFVQSLVRYYDHALRQLEAALSDCPDRLWETDLWPDEAPTGPHADGGLRGSAQWIRAHHALVCLDSDLTGKFAQWAPPLPIGAFLRSVDPTRVFTKAELLGYLAWCRDRMRQTLAALTEDLAARPLPDGHRYHGTPFGVLVGDGPLHLSEHAAQICQFLMTGAIGPAYAFAYVFADSTLEQLKAEYSAWKSGQFAPMSAWVTQRGATPTQLETLVNAKRIELAVAARRRAQAPAPQLETPVAHVHRCALCWRLTQAVAAARSRRPGRGSRTRTRCVRPRCSGACAPGDGRDPDPQAREQPALTRRPAAARRTTTRTDRQPTARGGRRRTSP
jgi:hypothetical protein